jgi:hypothetical protein
VPSVVAFTDSGDHFSITFPAQPTAYTEDDPSGGFDKTIFGWKATDPNSGDAYSASYEALPSGYHFTDPQKDAEDQVASVAAGGTLISSSAGSYQGYPSQDGLFIEDGWYGDVRIIVAGHVSYLVLVSSLQNPPPGFASFASSLQIHSTAPS